MLSDWITPTVGPDQKKCFIQSKYYPQTPKYAAACHHQKLWFKIWRVFIIYIKVYSIY